MGQFPAYVISSKPTDVRLSSLKMERDLYDNYPPFQRDKVWTLNMKRSLIDSILRGFYIPAVLVFRQKDLPLGHSYWVIDGQQRLTTIFEFMEDKFTTSPSKSKDEPHYSPVEPNRRYSHLSTQARELFDSYTLHFRILEGIEESMLGVLFRRLQNQQPLLGSEKLWSYTSETTNRAIKLLGHPFWTEIYAGKKDRKRDFQISLYLIFVEIFEGYANMTTPRLRDLASGTKDSLMSDELIGNVLKRLDEITHVFYGASLNAMGEAIPVYQAVLFLSSGYDLKKSDRGCLAPWFGKIKQKSLESRMINGNGEFLNKITHHGYQRDFWLEQLPIISASDGLFSINKKRSFDQLDRIQAWNNQKGLCPICGKAVKLSDIAHHLVQYAAGGPTISENCAVVHKECHQRVHAGRETNWIIKNEEETLLKRL